MNGTKVLGLAAVGAFVVMAAPVGSAQAMSLISPGAAVTVREDAKLPLALASPLAPSLASSLAPPLALAPLAPSPPLVILSLTVD
jgi:hypothetical protein